MKTMMANASQVEQKWYVVDADGKVLGRLASEVAKILKGKHKPTYTPHVDTGDFVIIINAEKVIVTGKKETQKLYRHHTTHIGGLKEVSYKAMMEKHPERILQAAIKGMLPKNTLGRQMLKKLKVYVGPEHKNQAQIPEVLEIKA
ncbi:MAG: 50S ribosomal protein L13 [Clostridia bacterium]|nr:50S ribosomal protein L13 [Clostridia bacterium]